MTESVLDLVQQLKSDIKQGAEVVVTIQPECTVFEVATPLREKYPDHFPTLKGLEVGLHHRTLKKTETEVFKFEIACILHFKLATSRNSSWERFAQLVVRDVNRARLAYSVSSSSSSSSSSGPCLHSILLGCSGIDVPNPCIRAYFEHIIYHIVGDVDLAKKFHVSWR